MCAKTKPVKISGARVAIITSWRKYATTVNICIYRAGIAVVAEFRYVITSAEMAIVIRTGISVITCGCISAHTVDTT